MPLSNQLIIDVLINLPMTVHFLLMKSNQHVLSKWFIFVDKNVKTCVFALKDATIIHGQHMHISFISC